MTEKENTLKRQNLFSRIKWILFVSRRFSRVDRDSRSAATGLLSSLGICFGVMTLIVTLSVMNGFQRGYIDSIMEISSAHIRFTAEEKGPENTEGVLPVMRSDPAVVAAAAFYEAQTLMTGTGKNALERQIAAVVRAVPADLMDLDAGFARELQIRRGQFDLVQPNSIVLGAGLATSLGVTTEDTVNLLALSGGSDVDLLSANREFTVTGIFRCGYPDISAAYAFISIEDGQRYFGAEARKLYALKIKNPNRAYQVIERLAGRIPGGSWESWQSYNRAFFGALRVEKNMLMMFVFIIFVVVGVNIYNGMRRMVYERRSEIAVFSALGGRAADIQTIFIMRGFLTGFAGAVPGLLLGLLICVRIDSIFMLVSEAAYFFSHGNPMYLVYASIPARIYPLEALMTTVFGIFSALAASWAASGKTLNTGIAEVLRDE
jgi:lipoprotein-releasing system permease protein